MTKTPFRPTPPHMTGPRESNDYLDDSGFPYPAPPRRRANWLIFLTTTVLTLMALIIIYGLFFRDNDSAHQKPKEKPAVEATDEPMDIDSGEQWMGDTDGSAVHVNIPGDGGGATTIEQTTDATATPDAEGNTPTKDASSTAKRIPIDDPPVMDEQPITSIEAEAQQKKAAAAAQAKAKKPGANGGPTPPLPGQ